MKIFLYTAGDKDSHKKLGKELAELKEGSYVITVKKNRPIRSLSQNKYYHMILNIIAIDTGHTHEELHEAMKLKFNSKIIFFPKGGSQMVGNTTSDLDTKEFTAFVNRVKQFAIDEFGIVIPELKDATYQQWLEINNAYEENNQG